MREIERVLHDRIISRDLWPARSPDINPPAISIFEVDCKYFIQDNPTHSGRTET